MIAIYILLGIFFCSTVVLTFLYLRNLNRLKKISEDILHTKIRKGYFNEKVRIDSTYEFSDFISSLLFINIMNAIIIIYYPFQPQFQTLDC